MGYLFEESIELCVTFAIGNESDVVLLSLPAYTTLFGLDQVNSKTPTAIHISSRSKVLDIDRDSGLTCWCRLDEQVCSLRSTMTPLIGLLGHRPRRSVAMCQILPIPLSG